MSSTAIFWTVYLVGYFVWFGYAINRFCTVNGDECFQAILALAWPVCVAVYVPYRIFKWLGVRAR
jgi:hypothetical protein